MNIIVEVLGTIIVCIALVLVGICGVLACTIGVKEIKKVIKNG